jgi:hypothetical protein
LHFFIATDNHLSFIRFNLQRFPHNPDDRVVGIGAFIAGFGTWLDRHSHNFVVNLYPLPPSRFWKPGGSYSLLFA